MDLAKKSSDTLAPDLTKPQAEAPVPTAAAPQPRQRILYECDECGDDDCEQVTLHKGNFYCDYCLDFVDDDDDDDDDLVYDNAVVHHYHGPNYIFIGKMILIVGLVLCGCLMQIEGQKETASSLFSAAMLAFWFLPSGNDSDD